MEENSMAGNSTEGSGRIRLLYADEIECRTGMVNEKGLSLLLYKDARVDMKILDEAYGADGWQRTHEMIGGSLYCTVSVWDSGKGQWISKMDVGTESFSEKEKGAASDSFKRACVSVGIGRELYTAPFIWIPASKAEIVKRGDKYYCNDRFRVAHIGYNGKREISCLTIMNRDGNVVYAMQAKGSTEVKEGAYMAGAAYGFTSDTEAVRQKMDALGHELARTGIALGAVLKRYGLASVEEMTDETYRKAMNSLKRTKTAQAA